MITIRKLQKDVNFKDILGLSREFFAEYEDNHQELFKVKEIVEKDTVEYFAKFINDEKKAAFVAVNDKKIIGYIAVYITTMAACWEINATGVISGLMVTKAFRRKGVAKKLMAEARAFFREKK